MPSILEAAQRQAVEEVRRTKPSQFTVGGHYDGRRMVGGLTYDRTWKNGWGLTAYARAWWDDEAVTTHTKRPSVEAGGEITKRF